MHKKRARRTDPTALSGLPDGEHEKMALPSLVRPIVWTCRQPAPARPAIPADLARVREMPEGLLRWVRPAASKGRRTVWWTNKMPTATLSNTDAKRCPFAQSPDDRPIPSGHPQRPIQPCAISAGAHARHMPRHVSISAPQSPESQTENSAETHSPVRECTIIRGPIIPSPMSRLRHQHNSGALYLRNDPTDPKTQN